MKLVSFLQQIHKISEISKKFFISELLDVAQIKSVDEFCDKLNITKILHLLEAAGLTLSDILQMNEADVNDLIAANFMKERLKLRDFISSFRQRQKAKEQSAKDQIPSSILGYCLNLSSILKHDFNCVHLIDGSQKLLDAADANSVAKVIVNYWKVHKISPSRTDFVHAFKKVKELFAAESIDDWIGGLTKGRGLLHERLYNVNKLEKKHKLGTEYGKNWGKKSGGKNSGGKDSGGNKVGKDGDGKKRKTLQGKNIAPAASKRKVVSTPDALDSSSPQLLSLLQQQQLDYVHPENASTSSQTASPLEDRSTIHTEETEGNSSHENSDLSVHSDDSKIATDNETTEFNNDPQRHFDFLKNNYGPLHRVLESWNFTYVFRQGMDYEIKDYKALQSSDGHVLMTKDFDRRFGSGNALHLKFANFKKQILPLLDKNVKDTKCKKLLQLLSTENISENSENYLYLMIIHAYILSIPVKEDEIIIPKKSSILDSQKFFIFLVRVS